MSANKDGIPNNDTIDTVITLIGIIRFSGCANKLYPYTKKELIMIFRNILNNFIIGSPITNYSFILN